MKKGEKNIEKWEIVLFFMCESVIMKVLNDDCLLGKESQNVFFYQ